MYKSLLIAAAVLSFACSVTSSSYANPMAAILVDAYNKKKAQGDLGTQGGQNDPAQMFQQILNDLTKGQQRVPGGEGSSRVPSRPANAARLAL